MLLAVVRPIQWKTVLIIKGGPGVREVERKEERENPRAARRAQNSSLVQSILPPFAKMPTRVLRALLFSLRHLSSARVLFRQTIPKRHPHVVMRPSRSWCDVSLGTIDD